MPFFSVNSGTVGILISPITSAVRQITLAAATEPDAFTVGQWLLTPIVGGLRINITSLPADNGSPITSIQYRLDGGAWVTMAGTGLGDRDVLGLSGVEYDVELRAVNSVGNGLPSDIKSATPTVASNPMIGLLSASTFGMAMDFGDQNVTRCYTETTGLAATTLCADTDQIGTIRCMITDRVITFPTGVRPVYRTDGPRAYMLTTSTTQRILWTAGSAFTGGGRLAFAFSGMQLTEVSGTDNNLLLAAIFNDAAFWNTTDHAGLQLSGTDLNSVRNFFGGGVVSLGTSLDPDFAVTALLGPADVVRASKKSGNARTTGSASVTGSPAWNVNQATFTCADTGEGVRFEGRVYFAAVLDVATADAAALTATIQTRAEAAVNI